jgi:hypothetical protein
MRVWFSAFLGHSLCFPLLMVLPRAYVSRFTPLSQTYYFQPLSTMNPFQQLQQKADRMQGGGGGSGGQQNEEAELWKNKLIGKTLIDDGQETELGEDQVSGYHLIAVMLCFLIIFLNWLAD